MIIDVDIGNSRIKWRSSSAPEALAVFTLGDALPEEWRAADRMRISSVLTPEKTANFVDQVKHHCGVAPQLAVVQDRFAGLLLAYADPTRLGVDRWLAMLAVREKFPRQNCVVCSGGTALTVDLVEAGGRHLGGFIVPGLRVFARALWQNTDGVGEAREPLAERQSPGTTTLECVEAGLTLLYQGFFGAVLHVAPKSVHASRWIFTGGDAEYLQRAWLACPGKRHSEPNTEERSIILPGLVLDGLAQALP